MLKYRVKERTNTWPGFVDLFSNLVIILIFLLIVFVFLWATTNVFGTSGGIRQIASLTRQNIEKTEELEQLRISEERARELLILAHSALQALEEDNQALHEGMHIALAESVEREHLLDVTNATLSELVASYEQKLHDMRSGEASMREIIQTLEEQLRVTTHDQRLQTGELETQRQTLAAELARMNALLGAAEAQSAAQEVRYVELSTRLNRALADKVAELSQMQDNLMDAEMRAALMGQFQSEFYRAIRTTLAGLPGVDVSSDRFLISSDILFAVGSFALSPDGRQQIGLIARVISELEEKIPQGTQWIIRVDGHTDIQPVVLGNRGFRNNTELSLLRAQAVVNELVRAGVQQRRLIPSGFGELFPIAEDTDPASLQKNRRIELRLTNP